MQPSFHRFSLVIASKRHHSYTVTVLLNELQIFKFLPDAMYNANDIGPEEHMNNINYINYYEKMEKYATNSSEILKNVGG